MNLTIRARLWAMVIVSIVALFGVGAVGSWTTRAEQSTVVSVMEGTMPSISTLGEIQSTFLSLEVDASGHIATKEPTIKDAAQKGVSESFKKLEAAFAAYEKLVNDETEKKMLATEKQLLSEYMPLVTQMMEASRAYDVDAASALMFGKLRPVSQKLKEALQVHVEYNRKAADELRVRSEEQSSLGSLMSWVGMILGAGIVGLLGVFTVRGIGGALRGMQETVSRVGRDRDFTARVPVVSRDELGDMATTLNRLFEQLQEDLSQLRSAAVSVAGAASEMAESATLGAENSEAQSQAASGMAATMQELSVSISHVGDQALEAQTLTTEAGRLASSGTEVISETIADINDIASNIRWVMSTNSIAVMPRPRNESWFMEGRLRPGYHYIEVRDDYSDLEEKIDYYIAHPEQAQQIIDHANDFARQFYDSRRERFISLLVMKKYFEKTGQLPPTNR